MLQFLKNNIVHIFGQKAAAANHESDMMTRTQQNCSGVSNVSDPNRRPINSQNYATLSSLFPDSSSDAPPHDFFRPYNLDSLTARPIKRKLDSITSLSSSPPPLKRRAAQLHTVAFSALSGAPLPLNSSATRIFSCLAAAESRPEEYCIFSESERKIIEAPVEMTTSTCETNNETHLKKNERKNEEKHVDSSQLDKTRRIAISLSEHDLLVAEDADLTDQTDDSDENSDLTEINNDDGNEHDAEKQTELTPTLEIKKRTENKTTDNYTKNNSKKNADISSNASSISSCLSVAAAAYTSWLCTACLHRNLSWNAGVDPLAAAFSYCEACQMPHPDAYELRLPENKSLIALEPQLEHKQPHTHSHAQPISQSCTKPNQPITGIPGIQSQTQVMRGGDFSAFSFSLSSDVSTTQSRAALPAVSSAGAFRFGSASAPANATTVSSFLTASSNPVQPVPPSFAALPTPQLAIAPPPALASNVFDLSGAATSRTPTARTVRKPVRRFNR